MRKYSSVTIQQPPVGELKKRSRHVKRACVSGCGCLLLFFVGSLILLKLVTGPKSVALKKIPQDLKGAISLYDEDKLGEIRVVSGKQKHPVLETAALVPKVILSPAILTIDEKFSPEGNKWTGFRNLIAEPLFSERDTYSVSWAGLTATPDFLEEYYRTKLGTDGFTVRAQAHQSSLNIGFAKEDIDGTIRIWTAADGTTSMDLTIHLVRSHP